ncbi:DUF6904 family protein [Psychrobacillus psychrodurans]|uniref:Uncharacterized protein n=1 Tax=Psychrobacillus psychrodurans TaxID=126157 RepID=A0A9X3R9M9_9BACI|nr:hypothetical protein [Psychrobacillus psychrodurans]MCZ8533640.1 hypothetical protein [Psychrobacillus psychrodurans]
MLALKNTENLTGALISGDYWDLDELCTALHRLTGKESRYLDWQGARMRLLSIMHDIRNAYQGNSNVESVGNGLKKDTMKNHDFIASQNNIYFSTEILWPELIFTLVAINDFINLHKKYEQATDLEIHIVNARKFQALIAEGLRENMSEESYTFIMQQVLSSNVNAEEYASQYIDLLNISYIDMSRDRRIQSFESIVHNIVVQSKDYSSFKKKILTETNKTKSTIHDFRMNVEYPEYIEW